MWTVAAVSPQDIIDRSARAVNGKKHIAYPGILIPYLDILATGDTAQMSHTIRKKKKLAHRVARIRGQVEALARALDGEAECGDVLRLIASARGAMDGLMAEVIEGHIRDHAFRGTRARSEDRQAAEDLIDIIRSYLK
jgi:DNA-binding FrmR family transcriptional regulator